MSQPDPLYADHRDRFAQKVLGLGLDRCIAAAMQHERRVAAQQPRGVDTKREIGGDALIGITGYKGLGLGLGPTGFHGTLLLMATHKADGSENCKGRARRLFPRTTPLNDHSL